MIQLHNILRLLETMDAQGGVSSAVGSALGRAGFAKPYENAAEQQAAFGQRSNLKDMLHQREQALKANEAERETLADKIRRDQHLQAFADPNDTARVAELERLNALHQQQMAHGQRQLSDIDTRMWATQNPRQAMFRQRATMAGGFALGAAAAQSIPGLVSKFGGQAAGDLASFASGDSPAGGIAGQMGKTAVQGAANIASGGLTGASIGMLAGPEGAVIGAAVGAMASAAQEVASLPKKIKDWSDALAESQRHIARYSGTLSQAFALSDVRTIRRDIMSAGTTGESSAGLIEAISDLNDTLRPLKDTLTVATSLVLTELVGQAKSIGKSLQAGIDLIPDWATHAGLGIGAILGLLKDVKEAVKSAEQTFKMEKNAGKIGARAAIDRLLAEDINKPRQAARR